MASQDQIPTAASAWRHLPAILLKVAVSVGLLTLLLSRTDLSSLGTRLRTASVAWMAFALALYLVNVLVATWRWQLLLSAQRVTVHDRTLLGSYLVATFFNNFLPSNIGGDIIRIRDTAGPAHSRTVAATVVLIDRGIGLMGLMLVAATGASLATASGGAQVPVWPAWLWATFLLGTLVSAPAVYAPAGVERVLQPLKIFHAEWVGERIGRVTGALGRLREHPGKLVRCFAGAVVVQAVTVIFYAAVARGLGIPIALWHLAVVVPLSFVVQMFPVSVNGFGVREATFSFYFARLHLPLESAIALSLVATGLVMLFSLSGAVVYIARRPHKVRSARHQAVGSRQ